MRSPISAEVVVVGREPVEPVRLSWTGQLSRRLFGHFQEEPRVPLADLRFLAGFDESFEPELTDRLEHPEARLEADFVTPDQAVLDQLIERLERIQAAFAGGGADRIGGLQAPTPAEDREPSEHRLAGGIQEIVAPLDRATQRALALRPVTRPAREQGEATAQALQHRLR
jgi:hypothetical protein